MKPGPEAGFKSYFIYYKIGRWQLQRLFFPLKRINSSNWKNLSTRNLINCCFTKPYNSAHYQYVIRYLQLKKKVLIMKTIMKHQLCITLLMTSILINAHGQITASMLSLSTLKNVNTGIEMKLKATVAQNTGEISWQSIGQIKVRRYELEKSSDGYTFSYVSAVPGNTGKFSVQDKYLFNDVNYYRLKIVDNKGNYSYSNTVSFDRRNTTNEIKVMPAISSEDLYIWLPANTQVNKASISDMMGREVMNNVAVNNLTNLAEVAVNNLAAGMYQINIATNTGVTASLKFSKK